MKRNLLLLLAIVSTILTANAQWELQTNPLGYGESAMVGKIQIVSPTDGWIAASKSGKLLHTTNGGNNWSIVDPFPELTTGNMSDPGLSMSWPDATHGFAVKTLINGSGGHFETASDGAVVFKTADGGSHWTKQALPKSISTTVYSTGDLTGTWQVHTLLTKNPNVQASVSSCLYGTFTVDGTGAGTLSLTKSNGGQITQNANFTVNSRGKIYVENLEIGFLSADKNTLILSTDEDYNTPALYILQKQKANTTYSMADLQGSWQMNKLSAGTSSGEYAGWTQAAMTCDAAGMVALNYTEDYGDKGVFNSSLTIDANGFVSGLTNSGAVFHGYMSADKNTFYATMSGTQPADFSLVAFQRKKSRISYTSTDLKGIWQVQSLVADNKNDNDRWSSWSRSQSIIGSQGNVSISDLIVNGETRNNMQSGMSITSTGEVTFNQIEQSHGFLSSDKSLIIFTMPDMGSGGFTFGVMQRDLSISGDLGMQIQFVDENTGWLSNYNPIYETYNIYKTTDGGVSWDSTHANAGGFYHFIDANNGWMIGTSGEQVGENGVTSILHSIDGGTTWQLQASNIGEAKAIYFSDTSNGWVVGKGGLVMHTTDGGIHWNPVTNTGLTANSKCKTLFFLDANHGWIGCGEEGTEGDGTRFVLATKNGGASWSIQPTPVTNSIFSISAWDANHVWFTSDYGQIAHYIAPKAISISAGGLNAALTTNEKETLQNLVVTGTMDARDFKVLRDQLPVLANLDLSEATVVAYSGAEGTVEGNYSYPDNTTPRNALIDNTQLQRIALPNNLISIGRSSFNRCKALSKIELPSNLQLIDSLAFAYCLSLKQLTLPPSVKKLAYGVFYSSGIEQITLNEGLTRIDDFSFQNCVSLRTIQFPSTVTEIGYSALYESGLQQITLNEGLKTIGDFAFQFCDSLRSITLPSTLTHIGYCALTFVNSLETITVAPENTTYYSEDGVLFDKAKKRLLAYPASKSMHYDIPSGITVIDTAAFEGNWKLKSVTIPNSVTELASEAFYYTQLSVIDLPSSISTIGSYCFYNCYYLSGIFTNTPTPINMAVSDSIFLSVNSGCTLYVPKGSAAAYTASEGWSHYLSRIKEFEKATDVEGNVYHGIQIGTQTWLVENLRTSHFNNNNLIQKTDMDLTNSPNANFGWDMYDDPSYSHVYGKYYTWNAANDQRGICPFGYKIPTSADWQTLISYVSSHSSTSTTKALASPGLWWDDPNAPEDTPANMWQTNNESGLMIFPAGVRFVEGGFDGGWGSAYLWTSDNGGGSPIAYHIENNTTNVLNNWFRYQDGFSVRCVKDPTVAVENLKADKMDLYPNPASTDFRINGLQGTAVVTITNLSGQVLVTKTITSGQNVQVSDLADGMYLVTIRTNSTSITKNLIVRHRR